MKSRIAGWFLAIASLIVMASWTQPCLAETRKPSKKLWAVSVAALVAANVFDAHSSMGRAEANPLLRDARGRFNTQRGFLIKSSASGGSLLLQFLLFRNHRAEGLYGTAAVANLACAGAVAGTALHNARLSKPAQTPDYLKPQ